VPLFCPDNSETLSGCFRNQCPDTAEIRSSSSDLFDDGILYESTNVFDQNPKTAWVPESRDKNGIEEWLDIIFYPKRIINSLQIINGYAKSETIYRANNRVKRLKITFDDGSSIEEELKDGQMGFQKIKFINAKKIGHLRILIEEVYLGSKYHDTCISEISFQ